MLDDRILVEIKLTQLQVEMQDIASSQQTYVTITYSSMIALVVFLFSLAFILNRVDPIYVGIIVWVVCVAIAIFIDRFFRRKTQDIMQRIQRLKQKYEF